MLQFPANAATSILYLWVGNDFYPYTDERTYLSNDVLQVGTSHRTTAVMWEGDCWTAPDYKVHLKAPDYMVTLADWENKGMVYAEVRPTREASQIDAAVADSNWTQEAHRYTDLRRCPDSCYSSHPPFRYICFRPPGFSVACPAQ